MCAAPLRREPCLLIDPALTKVVVRSGKDKEERCCGGSNDKTQCLINVYITEKGT